MENTRGQSAEPCLARSRLCACRATRARARLIAELEQLSRREVVLPLCFAYVYTGLCRNDEAFEWLERAFQARNSQLYWLKVVPSNDALRADPRYWDLVRRLGLPRGAK